MSSEQDSLHLYKPESMPRQVPAIDNQYDARSHAEFAFLVLDVRGNILFCSPDAAHLLGAQDKILTGQSVADFIPTLPLQAATSGYNLAYIGFWARNDHWQTFPGVNAPIEIRFNHLELAGQTFVTLELRSPKLNAPEQALQKLIHSMKSSSEIMAITNNEGVFTYVNHAFEQFTGYRHDELLGQTHALLGAEKSPELYAQMWATLRTRKPFNGIFITHHKNGQTLHEDRSTRPFIDHLGRPTHYIFSSRDVSDRERVIQRLERLANHDGLTGLPNRNLFMDRMRQAMTHAMRRNTGFSLLLLDLDHFKAINDRFGHAGGDALLIAVANRLKRCVREEDTVARLGGDEFAIILSETMQPDAALIVVEKLIQDLRQPFVLEGCKLPTNASIGIALYPEDCIGLDTLIKFADIAMYRAKSAGGNGYHFHRQRGTSARSARLGAAPINANGA